MCDLQYLTIEQQIELLKNKGLIIENEEFSKITLIDIGYYKLINGYKHLFQKKCPYLNDYQYINDAKFESIHALYSFDVELSHLTLRITTKIETKFKSLLSNLISEKYGINDKLYFCEKNFNTTTEKNKNNFSKIYKFIYNDIETHLKTEHRALTWYNEKYQFYPFWVLSNILTFGTISKLFNAMKPEDQQSIARTYNIEYNTLISFIQHLVLVRNVCAHNDVLFNYKTLNYIKTNSIKNIYNSLGIQKNEKTDNFEHGINDYLSTIIVFKLLLNKEDFTLFVAEINKQLVTLKKLIPLEIYENLLNLMGLVKDWDRILNSNFHQSKSGVYSVIAESASWLKPSKFSSNA